LTAGLKNMAMYPDSNGLSSFADKNNGMSQLIKFYEHMLIGIVVLLPLLAAAYIYLFQDSSFVIVSHGLHEVAISVAILQSGFVGYVTWRCYVSSGEPFMRWLTLSFIGFALIYAFHGLFTLYSDCHMALFLVYGPASRLVMAGFLLTGLFSFGRTHHPIHQRTQRKFWVGWMLSCLTLDVFLGWLALSQIIPFQTLRMFMEVTAMLLIMAGMAVVYLRGIQSWMMLVLTISLAYLGESSLVFIFARPWNHLWWLAHLISAAGFTVLSYGVIRAFRTTRVLSQVFRLEEVMAQLAEARVASEENAYHFKNILENLNIYVALLDTKGVILDVNQALLDRTVSSRDAVTSQLYYDLACWSYDVSVQSRLKEAIEVARKGGMHRYDVSVKMGSDLVPIDFQISPIFDKTGRVVNLLATGVDITERKRKEEELIVSEERFRQLFEKSFIGIAWQNEHKILAANPAFCKLFGYTVEELGCMTIASLVHPDCLVQTGENIRKVLAGELASFSEEMKYVRKNGEVFWVHSVAVDFTAPGSTTRKIMVMVEDITGRMEQEEMRLRNVKEQRDVLVREVHHRIKNNLQGVAGLLHQHALDHPEMNDIIQKSINRIYSIAIIHGMQSQSMSEEVDLDELIHNIVNASGTSAVYEIEMGNPVFLDNEEGVPIALVINELITNATKHSSGTRSVLVRLENRGSDTVITIANQYDASLMLSSGGQGLNLVKSLLPRNAASMQVTSSEDQFAVVLTLSPPVLKTGPKPNQ
jgi:PAS domain S-box-containing protein